MNYEIFYGTMLGDGCIARMDNGYEIYYRFEIEHTIKDKEYSEWLQSNMSDVLPYWRERHRQAKLDGRSIKSSSIHLSGKTNKDFESFHQEMYPNGKKTVSREWLDKLTPLSLAVWYMDDGSYHINRNTIEISTYSFSLEEHHIMQSYFKEKWDIDVSIAKHSKHYYIYFPRDSATKFLNIIHSHIIPCMKRKLPEGWETAIALPSEFHKRLNRKQDLEINKKIIIDNLQEFCRKNNVTDKFPVVKYNYSRDSYSYKVIQFVFGSWVQALAAANLPTEFI